MKENKAAEQWKFNICTVIFKKPDKFSFKCTYFINHDFNRIDDDMIQMFGKGICQILNNYINFASLEEVFKAYILSKDFSEGKIYLDIDHEINVRLSEQERQKIADLAARILKILSKYMRQV